MIRGSKPIEIDVGRGVQWHTRTASRRLSASTELLKMSGRFTSTVSVRATQPLDQMYWLFGGLGSASECFNLDDLDPTEVRAWTSRSRVAPLQ